MPKPNLADKKSAFAATFNGAVELVAASDAYDVAEPDAVAEVVVDLNIALYTARIAAQKELKLGGVEDSGKSSGGSSGQSGGSNKRSGGSSRSSGRSDSPSRGQIDYASDILDRLEEAGSKLPTSLKKFKKMSYAEGKEVLEDLIDIDPK